MLRAKPLQGRRVQGVLLVVVAFGVAGVLAGCGAGHVSSTASSTPTHSGAASASAAPRPGRGGDPVVAYLAPPTGPSGLAAGSDPSVLPGPVLIADKLNNRLLIVNPHGRVRWEFPRPGDLAPGQSFKIPDDAFFSPDGTKIIATQEDDYAISVIDIASHRIVYRYGHPGTPGSAPGYLDNPDDALLLPGGDILTADIKNCRILLIDPGRPAPVRSLGGAAGGCRHDPRPTSAARTGRSRCGPATT